MNVNGNLNDTSVASLGFFVGDPEASVSLDGKSILNVNNGAFTNTASFLYLTDHSTASVAGLFTNDVSSVVSLDQPTSETAPSGSILNANGGFTNSGEIALNNLSTLNNTEAFDNTGLIFLEGSALTTLNSETATGSFTNDGSLGYPAGFVSVDTTAARRAATSLPAADGDGPRRQAAHRHSLPPFQQQ